VVRDALGTQPKGGVIADAGLNVFGPGDINGPTAGYVRVELDQINPICPDQSEQLNNGPPQKFGVRDINTAIAQAVFSDLTKAGSSVAAASAAIQGILGATLQEIQSGAKTLSPWQVLVVQAGATGKLVYDAKQTGVDADAVAPQVIVGGANGNDIKGSSGQDYIVGGAGNDHSREEAETTLSLGAAVMKPTSRVPGRQTPTR
jgi:hypothetical protein